MTARKKIKPADVKSELREGQSIELLKELHILTQDGQMNADSRRKLKQVYHLIQFIEPALKDAKTIVDVGSGKSYLGFMMYDLALKQREDAQVFGIETRPELQQKAEMLAQKLKFDRMHFLTLTAQESLDSKALPKKIDVLCALHACDTATDDAIDLALHKKADSIFLVPCCQATLARELTVKGFEPLSELWRHGIHRREFGSHLTNVLRCLRLEAAGYQVTVTELTGWEHSLKNELIIAKKVGAPLPALKEKLKAFLDSYPMGDYRKRF